LAEVPDNLAVFVMTKMCSTTGKGGFEEALRRRKGALDTSINLPKT
jgi:hypothetical protein